MTQENTKKQEIYAKSLTDEQCVKKENDAVNAIKEISEIYGEDLAFIWHWGAGDGSVVLELLTKNMLDRGLLSNNESSACKSLSAKAKKKIGSRLRLNVYERDSYKCVHCGSNKDLTLDHKHPESLGGQATIENLQTLCRSCNSKKGIAL